MSNRRTKLPWCQVFPADHIADPELSRCSPATRGIWVDWQCHMWQAGQAGELQAPIAELVRLGRCNETEAQAALDELERTGAGHIERVTSNGNETVVYVVRNRRMHRAAKARKSNTERQMRHRDRKRNGESNAGVTGESRDRVQKLAENIISTQGSDRLENAGPAALPTEWIEVVVVLRACGVGDAEAACRSARERGATPAEVRAACEDFQRQPGAWSPGLLHAIVSKMRGGERVLWPEPSLAYQRRQAGDRVMEQTLRRRLEGQSRRAALGAAELEERRRIFSSAVRPTANGSVGS